MDEEKKSWTWEVKEEKEISGWYNIAFAGFLGVSWSILIILLFNLTGWEYVCFVVIPCFLLGWFADDIGKLLRVMIQD